MSKHTPAPWFLKKWETETYKGCEIMGFPDITICSLSNLNWEANAKLIAAAPELLEALEAMKDYCKYHKISLGSGIVQKVDEAIKKATL